MAKPKHQKVIDAKEALQLADQRLANKRANLNKVQPLAHLTFKPQKKIQSNSETK